MLLVRCPEGVRVPPADWDEPEVEAHLLEAVLFLLSPKEAPGRHLRLLGHLATRVEDPTFIAAWQSARTAPQLRATLLPDERIAQLEVDWGLPTERWIDVPLRSIELPAGTLVALVRRAGGDVIPDGATVLRAGDRLSVIGEPEGIRELAATASEQGARPVASTEGAAS
jgi:Trk K+ transport system NAD-binding subunit